MKFLKGTIHVKLKSTILCVTLITHFCQQTPALYAVGMRNRSIVQSPEI